MANAFYEAVWALVRTVPKGKVVTYGQIATWLGSPRAARAVGYAMFNVEDATVPWHRVINGKGEISIGGHLHRPGLQRELLEHERVKFVSERVDLATYRHEFAPGVAEKVASSSSVRAPRSASRAKVAPRRAPRRRAR